MGIAEASAVLYPSAAEHPGNDIAVIIRDDGALSVTHVVARWPPKTTVRVTSRRAAHAQLNFMKEIHFVALCIVQTII